MTAAQMLKKAGYPDTEAGRQAFYKKYPTKDSFMKKFAKGGDTELAFPQQPDSSQFFNMGTPATFPGPFYAHGGSHMPLVHYQMAGQVDPQAAQAMMDNQGGNIPFATRQPGGAPVNQLPRFEDGGMDPKAMAEQILAIKEHYSKMTPRELKKEMETIQEELASGYATDPTLPMKQTVIAELLGQEMPMAQTGGIAFPQQPAENQFFTGEHFNNQYRKGGAPCYKCGGMYDTGGNTPFNYGYFPLSMGAGGYVGLDTTDNTDYLTYAAGGESPQGFTMQDFRDNKLNQFKGFLANTAQAYNAGQVMQQGQMEDQMPPMQQMPPQNAMGGYNAMMPGLNMQYGSQYNTDSFSQVNPEAYANMQAQQSALNNLTKEGAGKNFMGNLYGLMATKHQQKQQAEAAKNMAKMKSEKDNLLKSVAFDANKVRESAFANKKADDEVTFKKGGFYNFLPKHAEPPGNTSGATNTGSTMTPEMIAWINEQMKNKQAQSQGLSVKDLDEWYNKKMQGTQQQGFFNPYFGEYQPAGYGFMGAPVGSRYKIKIKGRGTMPYFGTDGTQGTTTTSGTTTTTQGQGAGAGMPPGFSMDKFDVKMGLLGKWLGPRRIKAAWHYGAPGNQQPPVQGPIQDPNAKKTTTTTTNNTNTNNSSGKPYGPREADYKTYEGPYQDIDKNDLPDYLQIPDNKTMQPVYSNKPSFSNFMRNNVIPYSGGVIQNQDDSFPTQRDPNTLPGPREQQAYGGNIFNYGGSQDDIIWMDEDEISRFEAGGGVLEYVNGGQFKQYY